MSDLTLCHILYIFINILVFILSPIRVPALRRHPGPVAGDLPLQAVLQVESLQLQVEGGEWQLLTVWPRVVSVRTGETSQGGQLCVDGGVDHGQGEDVWHMVVTFLHYECQVID